MISQADLAANLSGVTTRITDAARAAGRDPAAVTLVAVGKTFSADVMGLALAAGQRVFGENRVQEAAEKWPPLRPRYPDLRLHLIGPLQSNKVKEAVALFDVIETIDREKVARRVAAEITASGRAVRCLVQVNTGEEPQKAGVSPGDADDFVGFCRDQLELPVTGLMCIPPLDEEPSLHFALLAQIAERNDLAELSMGMSADFDTAIAFGATLVRVGTAIFGPRDPRP
ncbi:MAG: YggS family pyridoxal phosphate-dependent enzyme [Alphaproteobacteria bacterium]|nr:YggS family pyridoxal phosphate-dependent enzyme [Alphaproteobacteria bacterium]